jgi:hypothetical protein
MLLLSSCEWESQSHGSRGALETLSQRVHYKSGRENMTLVDDIRGRDDDKWRTRDMFALSSVARGAGDAGTLGQMADPLNPHGSDILKARIPAIPAGFCYLLNVNVHIRYSSTVYEDPDDKPTLKLSHLCHATEEP